MLHAISYDYNHRLKNDFVEEYLTNITFDMIPYISFDIFVARCGYSLSRIENMASTNVRGGAVY